MDDRLYLPVDVTLDSDAIDSLQEHMPGRGWDWFKGARADRATFNAAAIGDVVPLPGPGMTMRFKVANKGWTISKEGEMSMQVTLTKA